MGADKEADSVDDTTRDLVDSVDEEIVTSVKQYYLWWRIWNTLTISAIAGSILFSFVASVVAATKSIQNPVVAATIAGVPEVVPVFRARSGLRMGELIVLELNRCLISDA